MFGHKSVTNKLCDGVLRRRILFCYKLVTKNLKIMIAFAITNQALFPPTIVEGIFKSLRNCSIMCHAHNN